MRYAFILIFLAATLIAQQQPAARAEVNSSGEGDIKAVVEKLADLIVRGDWDEYASHLAPDYQHTRDNGHVENREQALMSLRDAKRKIIVMEMEPSDATFRIYGDTGIANAEFSISARESGQVKTRRIRQTYVFVKRDGQWSLVAEQDTGIGK